MSVRAAPERGGHFVVLDSWRGIAALAVALRHINGTAFFLTGSLHSYLSCAVDFFFVLSGFVIAASYGERLARGFSPLRFLALRWWRVWPLHATMVLVYLLLETILWLKGAGGVLSGREAFTGPREPITLLPTLLLLQAWIWPGRDLWNVQSWSISVEMALYVGAALLWRGLGARANWAGLVLALVALWGLGAGLLYDGMLRGVAGFGLGMACWALWPRIAAWRLPRAVPVLLEPALVGAVLAGLALEAPLALLDPLFAAAVLVFAREEGPVSRLLQSAPARGLGALSYALYMVHGLVIGRVFDLVAFAQGRLGGRWVAAHLGGADQVLLAPLPALGLVLVMLAASLGVAWLAMTLVERPVRQWSRRPVVHPGAAARAPR